MEQIQSVDEPIRLPDLNEGSENALFVTQVVRAVIDLTLAPFFMLYARVRYSDSFYDPQNITNDRTPVLLIHGSGSNPLQWSFFRCFLNGSSVGHVFSVALNDSMVVNDDKTVDEYASERIAKKIDNLKELYLQKNIKLNEVILVGHSMGGLVAGAYTVNLAEGANIKVKALISLNTPWYGSKIADLLFRRERRPEGAFLTTSPETKNLRERLLQKLLQKKISIYTFSGSWDGLVRPHSSSLPIPKENQIFSRIHDHYSVMADAKTARVICARWIVPNTSSMSASFAEV